MVAPGFKVCMYSSIFHAYTPQNHKNPCSVEALVRGIFGSLVNIAEIFTNIHAVLWQNSFKGSYILLQKYHKNWACFDYKFSQKNKAALLKNLHQYLLLWKMSTKKFFCLIIFTIVFFVGKNFTLPCFVEKFPQNYTWLLNFLNISPCLPMSTKLSFVGKFSQRLALGENFHKNLVCYKKLHTNSLCWRTCRKFSQRFGMLENFHKNLICRKT